ncbi:DMT family transporter [Cryocola sp. 340MFSha3.1]|uniref:DMT family transporter n=2 Tax=Microbacteriaceae TaxID=85023 RepID=UPI000362BA80|nr:DMT family transporter [Cryocola sp. 340MFSha3.1]
MKVALQFVAMGLVWGASFLFMKVALEGVSFGQVAWARLVFGALTLGVIALIMRVRLPREPIVWVHFAVVAVTYCVIPFLLFAWAEQYVSSSLASIYNAVTPITTAILVTAAFRVEKLNRDQVLGVLIGVVGVVVVVGPWAVDALAGSLWGQLACLGAVTCYGFSFGYIRKFISPRAVSATTSAFMNIGLAAVIMILLTPVVAWHPITFSWPVLLSLLALGALGTGVVYIWNMNVLRAWGPTATSGVTYVTPVVGVALGILVLGEHLTWNEPVGAVIVFAGILLTQQRVRLFTRRQAELAAQEAAARS